MFVEFVMTAIENVYDGIIRLSDKVKQTEKMLLLHLLDAKSFSSYIPFNPNKPARLILFFPFHR